MVFDISAAEIIDTATSFGPLLAVPVLIAIGAVVVFRIAGWVSTAFRR